MAELRRNVETESARRSYANYDIEIHGNAVRRVYLPEEEPEIEVSPKRKRITREEIERSQREAHERAFGLGSFLLVSFAVCFVCFALFLYIGERGEMHNHTKTVKAMTIELNEKTVFNDNRLTAIEASVNYDELFAKAVLELNMKFPGKDQIVWFSNTESEYISQYEKIPQK